MTVENKEATVDMMKSFENLPEKDKGYVQGLIDGLNVGQPAGKQPTAKQPAEKPNNTDQK